MVLVLGVLLASFIELVIIADLDKQLLNREIRFNVYKEKVENCRCAEYLIMLVSITAFIVQSGVL